jgi:hypothetical protein
MIASDHSKVMKCNSRVACYDRASSYRVVCMNRLFDVLLARWQVFRWPCHIAEPGLLHAGFRFLALKLPSLVMMVTLTESSISL